MAGRGTPECGVPVASAGPAVECRAHGGPRRCDTGAPAHAPVLELAYRDDSKSSALAGLWVRVPPGVPPQPAGLAETHRHAQTREDIDISEVATTRTTRRTRRIEARLIRSGEELQRARARVQVLTDQLAHLRDVADEARTRELLDGHVFAERDARNARSDLRHHEAQLDEARAAVQQLVAERDQLLEQLHGRP